MLNKYLKMVVLTLIGLALTPGDCMAIVRPRVITITNSADALTLHLHSLDFLESVSYRSVKTIEAYRGDLNKLSSFIGSSLGVDPLTVMYFEVTRSCIESFKIACLQHEKPSTVQRRIDTIKAFCRYIREKYNTSDRAAGVRGVSREKPEFLGLTAEQHDRFLLRLASEDPRTRFIGYFLLNTGFRVVSAKAAAFGHVRADGGWLNDVPSKGNKSISVPISPTLRRELARYIESDRGQYPTEGSWPIVLSSHGAKRSQPETFQVGHKTLWRAIHDPLVAVGIPADLAHPHTLTTQRYLGNEKRILEEAMEA